MKKTAAALSLAAALSACDEVEVDTASCFVNHENPSNITASIADNFSGATIASATHLRAQPDGNLKTRVVDFPIKFQLFDGGYHPHDDYMEVDLEDGTCTLGNDNHIKWFTYDIGDEPA